MPNSESHFEVEIRCHFGTTEEAFKAIPFLKSCLNGEMAWSSSFYGHEFFKSGQLLRMSKTVVDHKTKYYMGWKSQDSGSFANIREEIDEVITNGVNNSQILKKLGAQNTTLSRNYITLELEVLGHHKFMSFLGHDRFGDYEPLGVSMKLMTCPALEWPILVEIEKTASALDEALKREKELHEFCDHFGLHDRLVRDEPPTLLYSSKLDKESIKKVKSTRINKIHPL